MAPRIRPYTPDDSLLLQALESRVDAYRPEDQPLVEAMYARAREAEEGDDPRWMAPPLPVQRDMSDEFDAFWVAEQSGRLQPGIVGMVGVQSLRAGEILPAMHPLAVDWTVRGGVAELRRLRVAPEARRQRLGWNLCLTVIAWTRENGYSTLVVNTTTPQLPALALYRTLGFRDAGISFVGKYELTWLEMTL